MCTHVYGNLCIVHSNAYCTISILHNIGGTQYREYTIMNSVISYYFVITLMQC